MKFLRLSSTPLFACAFLLGCATSATGPAITAIPADGIQVKLAGKPGDKETIETVTDMAFDATGMPGAPAAGKMNIKMTMLATYTLETVKDGKFTFKIKFDDVKMEGMPAGSPDPMSGMKGKEATVVMDESGKVVSTSGEAAQIAEQAGTGLNFPNKKIKLGETWEVSQKNAAVGGMEMTTVNKLEGMEKVDGIDCLVITSTSKGDGTIKMPKPGKTWIDPSTGRAVKGEATVEMTNPKLTANVKLRKVK